MLATDFAANGLPSSLRKPRAANSFDTPRNDSCPPLGRRLRSLRASAVGVDGEEKRGTRSRSAVVSSCMEGTQRSLLISLEG